MRSVFGSIVWGEAGLANSIIFHGPGVEVGKKRAIYANILTGIFVLLLTVGLFNLYSASVGGGQFYGQLRHMVIGLMVFFLVGWVIPLRMINTYAYYQYGLICLALALVAVLGFTAGGAQRWLTIGPINFQPSELAKISIAITVARFFYTNRSLPIYYLRDLWPIGMLVLIVFGLIFEQPDLGTAGVCLMIATAQLLFIRVDWRSLGIVVAVGLVMAIFSWNVLLWDYQKLRVLNLFNPSLDPYGSGYNSRQSLVAIGSGALFGKGFLQGTQTQLQFLPARHTDFIFSVFAEEHGFWASGLVFALFGIMSYLGLEIARSARNPFNSLLAIGAAALLFIEFSINVAMVLGVFPVVGVPLPFFSYGGSGMLTICIAFGLLVSIDRDNSGLARKSNAYPTKMPSS